MSSNSRWINHKTTLQSLKYQQTMPTKEIPCTVDHSPWSPLLYISIIFELQKYPHTQSHTAPQITEYGYDIQVIMSCRYARKRNVHNYSNQTRCPSIYLKSFVSTFSWTHDSNFDILTFCVSNLNLYWVKFTSNNSILKHDHLVT